MIKEIILENGTHSFIFVGIEPYDYLDKVLNIFESNFEFVSKKHISGWHSTELEYLLQDLKITIGNLHDVLSITLIDPTSESSLGKIRILVRTIDEFLTQDTVQ